jgi:hypothetical protein
MITEIFIATGISNDPMRSGFEPTPAFTCVALLFVNVFAACAIFFAHVSPNRLTTKVTKSTKLRTMIGARSALCETFVTFVCSFESTVRHDSSERGQRWGSVIPAKAGIQANCARTNLDSRLRGNDD